MGCMEMSETVLSDEQLGELAAAVHEQTVAALKSRGVSGVRLKGARLGSEAALTMMLLALEELSE